MKKLIAFFLSAIAWIALPLLTLAQDSTTVSDNPIVALIPESWFGYIVIILGAYEFIARVIPTVKDYSIVSKIIGILQWLSKSTNKIKK